MHSLLIYLFVMDSVVVAELIKKLEWRTSIAVISNICAYKLANQTQTDAAGYDVMYVETVH